MIGEASNVCWWASIPQPMPTKRFPNFDCESTLDGECPILAGPPTTSRLGIRPHLRDMLHHATARNPTKPMPCSYSLNAGGVVRFPAIHFPVCPLKMVNPSSTFWVTRLGAPNADNSSGVDRLYSLASTNVMCKTSFTCI